MRIGVPAHPTRPRAFARATPPPRRVDELGRSKMLTVRALTGDGEEHREGEERASHLGVGDGRV